MVKKFPAEKWEERIAMRRAWYADYAKRLEDALVTVYGRPDEELHADGVRRLANGEFGD